MAVKRAVEEITPDISDEERGKEPPRRLARVKVYFPDDSFSMVTTDDEDGHIKTKRQDGTPVGLFEYQDFMEYVHHFIDDLCTYTDDNFECSHRPRNRPLVDIAIHIAPTKPPKKF